MTESFATSESKTVKISQLSLKIYLWINTVLFVPLEPEKTHQNAFFIKFYAFLGTFNIFLLLTNKSSKITFAKIT